MLGVPNSNSGLNSEPLDLPSGSEILFSCLFLGVSRIPKELCLPERLIPLLARGLFFGVANRLTALGLWFEKSFCPRTSCLYKKAGSKKSEQKSWFEKAGLKKQGACPRNSAQAVSVALEAALKAARGPSNGSDWYSANSPMLR